MLTFHKLVSLFLLSESSETVRFAETLTSVNETDFGSTDYIISPDQNQSESNTIENTTESDMASNNGQTGWEGWDDQDEWKEQKQKPQLKTDIKIEESTLPVPLPVTSEILSETDNEGYDTAREGTEAETETEDNNQGTVTESEAFFSADEDIVDDTVEVITQVDIKPEVEPETEINEKTPKNSPRSSPIPSDETQTGLGFKSFLRFP